MSVILAFIIGPYSKMPRMYIEEIAVPHTSIALIKCVLHLLFRSSLLVFRPVLFIFLMEALVCVETQPLPR